MEDFQKMFPKRIITCKDPLDIESTRNIVYKTVEGIDLHCDVYLPKKKTGNKKLPVVFLIHGEAPVPGIKDMGCYISYGEMLASMDLAAVAFNHRVLMSGSSIQEVLEDIADARDFIRSGSAGFNIDVSKTGICSLSAGMPFGVYNALHDNTNEVKCFVGLYGFGDFRTFLSVLPDRRDLTEIIPEIITGQIGFPMLFVRAGLDMKLINDSLDRFIVQCLEMNADMDVYCHSTGHHAFDILDNNSRSHELIAKTMMFLRKHLQKDV